MTSGSWRAALLALAVIMSTASEVHPAVAQLPGAPEVDQCHVLTADALVEPMDRRRRVTIDTRYFISPACVDRPGDPYTAVVAWGDGGHGPALVATSVDEPSGLPVVRVVAVHRYRCDRPAVSTGVGPGFPILITVTNERIGRGLQDARRFAVPARATRDARPACRRASPAPARR